MTKKKKTQWKERGEDVLCSGAPPLNQVGADKDGD